MGDNIYKDEYGVKAREMAKVCKNPTGKEKTANHFPLGKTQPQSSIAAFLLRTNY